MSNPLKVGSQQPYAGIDAGGTGFKCIVALGPEQILVEQEVPVGRPEETLAECREFFIRAKQAFGEFRGLGLASFGPVDLDESSQQFGCITDTPKPYWKNTNVVRYFQSELKTPVKFETDVNGALLGEQRWGAAQGLHSAVYITVGTGVGAGVMVDGNLLHGAMHAEAGHMLLPRHIDDTFHGVCPFHGGCLEGLASGPALAERWQENPKNMADDHPAWSLQAHYLACFCVNIALVYSPQRIIFGGGVMSRKHLLGMIQKSYLAQMNGYLGEQVESVGQFIVPAKLQQRAGALGAIALAMQLSQ